MNDIIPSVDDQAHRVARQIIPLLPREHRGREGMLGLLVASSSFLISLCHSQEEIEKGVAFWCNSFRELVEARLKDEMEAAKVGRKQ